MAFSHPCYTLCFFYHKSPAQLCFCRSLPQRCYSTAFFISLVAENARFQLGAAAPAPAAGCDAHAALGCCLAVAVSRLQSLTIWLALRALWSVVDVARWGAGGRLRGDGAQQVVPLPQEVTVCTQAEASFTKYHARAAGLGGARPVVVLQLWQMSCISFCDELLRGDFFFLIKWVIFS